MENYGFAWICWPVFAFVYLSLTVNILCKICVISAKFDYGHVNVLILGWNGSNRALFWENMNIGDVLMYKEAGKSKNSWNYTVSFKFTLKLGWLFVIRPLVERNLQEKLWWKLLCANFGIQRVCRYMYIYYIRAQILSFVSIGLILWPYKKNSS